MMVMNLSVLTRNEWLVIQSVMDFLKHLILRRLKMELYEVLGCYCNRNSGAVSKDDKRKYSDEE